LIAEAKRLASSGQGVEAGSLLQAAVHELAQTPGDGEQRRLATELLLDLLFREGRDGRMSKVFRQYVADCSPYRNPEFDELYLAGVLATRTSPVPLRRRDRFLLLVQQFERTLALEGLVAECGCFRGLSSHILCSRLKRRDSGFHGRGYRIFDSFRGLSEPQDEDALASEASPSAPHPQDIRAGRFAASLQEVQQALALFPAIAYFPGWIPSAFPPAADERYRFVHIDVDLYQPTKASLEYFWPRLVPGGLMVCDDYNWPGGKRAVEAFCAAQGVQAKITASRQAVIERSAS
jgi:O-methyltransferase